MYKNVLTSGDGYFAEGLTLPKNTSVVCGTVLPIGKHLGGMGLYLRASSAVTLASGKSIIVSFENSADGVTFEDAEPSYSLTYESGLLLNALETISILPLPDLGSRVRVTIATDDSAAAGTIDVCVVVLAR